MRRLWRLVRTALRPLPRRGMVLSEGWSVAAGASGTLDPCDCDAAAGTVQGMDHRGPGPAKDACPRYRYDGRWGPRVDTESRCNPQDFANGHCIPEPPRRRSPLPPYDPGLRTTILK